MPYNKKELLGTTLNASGSFIVVGNQQVDTSVSRFLKPKHYSFCCKNYTLFWAHGPYKILVKGAD